VSRPPLPEAQHRLDLFEEGTLSGAAVVCLGGPGNECRWWCADPARNCETCSPDTHPWEPIGSCRIADWINACGVDDCHADADDFPFDEEGDSQPGIRSGLIETEWTGDDYIWRYPEPATAAAAS
jgi:hypothetical protein